MSVLKRRRLESKANYLNYANEICDATVELLARLSPRYGRILTTDTSHLAHVIVDEVEIANSIYPSDAQRRDQRKYHLLEARGALRALDVELGRCYRVLLKNPQGAFQKANGKSVPAADAERILENLADNVGTLIDLVDAAISGVLESDRKRK